MQLEHSGKHHRYRPCPRGAHAVGEKSGTLDRTAHLEFSGKDLDDYAYQRIVWELAGDSKTHSLATTT